MNLWLQITTYLEWAVLLLLLGLSVWSIGIMIDRRRAIGSESRSAELSKLRQLLQANERTGLEQWIKANPGLHAGTLAAAMDTKTADTSKVDRAVKSFLTEERLRLEKGLAALATLGANAPFIGLFGTVLGIIRAFAALGASQGGANSVMSGISQALYLTAAGLFVAIPAVIAFNYFSNRLKTLLSECDSLKELYLSKQSETA